MCKRDHLRCNIWLMGSESIKAFNVALYIVFLCIYKLPTPRQIESKLTTIQPQNFGKIKNSQPEPQFFWFLYKKRVQCITKRFLQNTKT